MHTFRLFALLLLVAGSAALAVDLTRVPYKVGERLANVPTKPATEFREIKWDDLIPSNWNPADAFKDFDLANLQDGDPRAMDALARMGEVWANARVEPSLNGAAVRSAGFVISLERFKD